ncbi:MAG: hypothetical protein R3A52_28075 [Polyangiales bacterium]
MLRAAFTRAWRRPELVDLEVLEGEHEERGVLEVRSSTRCTPTRWCRW